MTMTERNDGPTYRIPGITRHSIRRLSRRNPVVSSAKVAAYFCSIAFLVILYLCFDAVIVRGLAMLGLGIVFAHGVELQHEALHGNLFRSPALNAIVGRVLGAPMLVSFTQYRSFHFYHHRHVGTDRDEELFNYSMASFGSPVSFIVRAWNLLRIPEFVVTFLRMLQNDYPDKIKPSARRALLAEYTVLLALLSGALASMVLLDNNLALMLWILPWLLVAEPLHFMIEAPEHLACSRSTSAILRSTRSYTTNLVWGYIANHNNYHIEHHMFPSVPAHRLGLLHAEIRAASGHCNDGYWQCWQEILSTARVP